MAKKAKKTKKAKKEPTTEFCNAHQAYGTSIRWYGKKGSGDRICTKAYKKAWRKANPEKAAAYSKVWREANPEKVAAQNKAWREANPEKAAAHNKAWKEANPENAAAHNKAWKEANPEKVAAHNKAYARSSKGQYGALRASSLRRSNPCKVELTFKQFCVLREKPCHYCGGELPPAGHGLDRYDNTIRRYDYFSGNTVPCCETCNKDKGTLHGDEWLRILAIRKLNKVDIGKLDHIIVGVLGPYPELPQFQDIGA